MFAFLSVLFSGEDYLVISLKQKNSRFNLGLNLCCLDNLELANDRQDNVGKFLLLCNIILKFRVCNISSAPCCYVFKLHYSYCH